MLIVEPVQGSVAKDFRFSRLDRPVRRKQTFLLWVMVERAAEVTDSQMTTVLTCISLLTLDCFLIEQRGNKNVKSEANACRATEVRSAEPAGARTQ